MLEKIAQAQARYEEISVRLSDPAVISDNKQYTELMREYKNLTPLIDMYKRYIKAKSDYEDAKTAVEDTSFDEEFRVLAEEEMRSAKEETERCEEELKLLLLPRDPDDDRSVIIEIRAGAGGDEAALFANSIFRMYSMYAARQGWKIDLLGCNPTELGGYREISFSVEGEGVYAKLKFESGVHRVQRVPETESQGRIQTSTITVAVLPEVEDFDVNINPADLTIQTFRSSGAGGQHINKTESAVRIIHKPSGMVVECQEERSQMKNKDKAMKMLYSRLYEAEKTARDSALAEERRTQVGSGDRAEKIRTYNYPQSRVTDHRINFTLYKLDDFMNGNCDEIFEALRVADQTEKLFKEGIDKNV